MGQTLSLEWQAVWKVLALGLILGAGLPALFAAGIRSMAYGTRGEAEEHAAGAPLARPHPLGRVVAFICFAIVIMAVALGLTFIVASGFGKALSFEHIYPVIVDKK
jgi:hypothetical protein